MIPPPGFGKKAGGGAAVKGWQHPGAKAQPFLHPTAVAETG